MERDLSSSIVLSNVPRRYYRPDSALEQSGLAKFEKIDVNISSTVREGCEAVAREVAELVRQRQKEGRMCVLGLTGGRSPLGVYDALVRIYQNEGLSFSNVAVIALFEYYPIDINAVQSCINQIKSAFAERVDIRPENIFAPDGTINQSDISAHCAEYEKTIERLGGIDYQILGIGGVGNIGFNEPGSQLASKSRLILLDQQSRKEAVRLFGTIEKVPAGAITLGVGSILKAKRIALLAWGERKADVIKRVVEDSVSDQLPASFLQMHGNATVFLDIYAAGALTRISHPWLVTSCEWNNKLIRRAIVWLGVKLGKSILKLTNRDYNENGLSELLAYFGSAYNVNIQVFNDLQHTITGWPGGKPNADDTNRPERAVPYPKRVMVFSPHPDDDVISMGGTIKRLVDQGHEVHVCYQTSGNIAVGDDEILKYISFVDGFAELFGNGYDKIKEKCGEVRRFLTDEKDENAIDTYDVRTLKGLLRRGEAQTACRYIGVDEHNVHFLNLPFYETGTIKKGELTDKDVDMIKKRLIAVKPHQIYVAGDLADPHGTHRTCLDAVLAAIYELRDAEWIAECRVWMYRGAWMEWEIDHIEMAVPLSPEELRFKRNAILKHQSQMEGAPFLGDDERLFWQRSEDRNRATAELYNRLGLAAYEAIEAFVEWKPTNFF